MDLSSWFVPESRQKQMKPTPLYFCGCLYAIGHHCRDAERISSPSSVEPTPLSSTWGALDDAKASALLKSIHPT
jgi:hypothetical protein